MAMPRPQGKALQIAEKTIPNLRASLKGQKFPSMRSNKGDYEQRINRANQTVYKQFRRTYK